MDWYSISAAIAAAINFILAIFVYLMDKRKQVNRLFSALMVAIGLWSLFSVMVCLAPDAARGLFWIKMTHIPAILVPAIFIHFIFSLDAENKSRKVYLFYLFSLIFLSFIYSSQFITIATPVKYIGYAFETGVLYIPFGLYYFGAVILGFTKLVLTFRRNTGYVRRQALYLIFSMMFAVLTALSYFVINISSLLAVPPIDNFLSIANSVIFSMAVLSHNFLTVRVKAGRIAIISIVLIALGSLFYFTFLPIVYLTIGRIDFMLCLYATILFISFALLFKTSRNALKEQANDYIYGKSSHSRIVSKVSDALISMLEIRQLFSYLVDSIAENFGVKKIAILIKVNDVFRVRAAKNLKGRLPVIKEDSVIVKWLVTNQMALLPENLSGKENNFKEIKKECEKINAQLLVPLINKGNLVGILNLFEKSANKIYSSNDIEILESICKTAAIALENARLYEEAITDSLTGLYHHKYFKMRSREELIQAASYNYPLSLIMIDIDFFKRINDTHGHQVGDEVLKELSLLLKANVRSSDIVARYGGEEFAIITTGVQRNERKNHKQNVLSLAGRLRKIVQEERFSSLKLKLTISIGMAYYDGKDSSVEVEHLIKLADDMLYKSKEAGRNRVNHADLKAKRLTLA